jgi:hypothetical protein
MICTSSEAVPFSGIRPVKRNDLMGIKSQQVYSRQPRATLNYCVSLPVLSGWPVGAGSMHYRELRGWVGLVV